MKCAIIRFPGSNCDQDVFHALQGRADISYVWHKDTEVAGYDLVILPGGFSYGDYLRCGAIARYSPVMKSVVEEAEKGTLVLGICNGFQILCEAKLLPGALIRNKDLHFICESRKVRVENIRTPFTHAAATGQVLDIPVAHGEGSYTANEETLEELARERRILLRYCDERGAVVPEANPNGSARNIAGICNAQRNVFGLMPHPERAFEARLGSEDGRLIFDSILSRAV